MFHKLVVATFSIVLLVATLAARAARPSEAAQNLISSGRAAFTLAPPTGLRTTHNLAECRTYGGGTLAGVGCAAAMQNQWYILVWDWKGRDVDGFRVYQHVTRGTAGRTLSSVEVIQTISQHAQVRVALLDPSKTGKSGCFSVTAYSGTIESEQSAQTCVSPVSATNPVFKSVSITPSSQMQFYAYHHERTHLHYCSAGSLPNYADGTSVWRGLTPGSVGAGFGILMYEADWHAGTEPFACPEFFTQVLRLGLDFKFPPDVATVRSATLVGDVQSANADGQCSYSLFTLATELIALNPPASSAGIQPPDNSFVAVLPGQRNWEANYWLYAASSQPIAGFFTWPPTANLLQLNADVSSIAKQHNDGVNFLLEPQGGYVWATGDAFGSPAGSSFVHGNIGMCNTTLRNIRLNLVYVSTHAS